MSTGRLPSINAVGLVPFGEALPDAFYRVQLECFDEVHGNGYFFPMTMLTSSGLIRSGTVQPSRSYSAMHCSAKPLNFARAAHRPADQHGSEADALRGRAAVVDLVQLVAAAELGADASPTAASSA